MADKKIFTVTAPTGLGWQCEADDEQEAKRKFTATFKTQPSFEDDLRVHETDGWGRPIEQVQE